MYCFIKKKQIFPIFDSCDWNLGTILFQMVEYNNIAIKIVSHRYFENVIFQPSKMKRLLDKTTFGIIFGEIDPDSLRGPSASRQSKVSFSSFARVF